MSDLKRTVLYQAHLDAGSTMVDFGGWDKIGRAHV